MDLKIVVRRARTGDLHAINALTEDMHRYLAGLYGLELSAEELAGEHYDEEELKGSYVAEDVGKGVVGHISFSVARDEWAGPHYELEHVAVLEGYRGLGIGRKLFEVLLKKARRERVNITAGTLARNVEALRFYRELGFKPLSIGLLLDLQNRIPDI